MITLLTFIAADINLLKTIIIARLPFHEILARVGEIFVYIVRLLKTNFSDVAMVIGDINSEEY
jgi:hypothetical protein